MRLNESIMELGPFTVLQELGKIKDDLSALNDELVRLLPIDPRFLQAEQFDLAQTFLKCILAVRNVTKKSQIIVAGPELILLEALTKVKEDLSIILAVNDDIPSISLERITANMPTKIDCNIFQLPTVPYDMKPRDSILVTAGFYVGSGFVLIPAATRKIINFYRGFFFGESVLVNPFPYTVSSRPDGWVTVNFSDYFTDYVEIPEKQNEHGRRNQS